MANTKATTSHQNHTGGNGMEKRLVINQPITSPKKNLRINATPLQFLEVFQLSKDYTYDHMNGNLDI